MNIQEAIDFPRIHNQWKPDKVFLEKGASPDTVTALKGMGYDVEFPGGGDADVEGIVVQNGWLEGGAEIRTAESKASGY